MIILCKQRTLKVLLESPIPLAGDKTQSDRDESRDAKVCISPNTKSMNIGGNEILKITLDLTVQKEKTRFTNDMLVI